MGCDDSALHVNLCYSTRLTVYYKYVISGNTSSNNGFHISLSYNVYMFRNVFLEIRDRMPIYLPI